MLIVVSIVSVLLAVGVHHEAITLAVIVGRRVTRQRYFLAIAVLVVLVGHILEILLFGLAWQFLISTGGAELSVAPLDLTGVIYFSGSLYTSLGFGDIVPVGLCRLFAVLESVTGLVMIAWSAAFTFSQMPRAE